MAMAHYTSLNRCPTCLKSYKRPEHLRRHQFSHSGLRPYECELCGKKFPRSDTLKRHLQTCDHGSDDPPDSPGPTPKRLALSSSFPQHESTLIFPDSNELETQLLTSSDQTTLSYESNGLSFDHIAGWISCGVSDYDFNGPSDSWQAFMAPNSDTQTPCLTSDERLENSGSLNFLANFTSKTGLVSSFDCGTLEQRQRVAATFSDTVAGADSLETLAIPTTSDRSVISGGDETTSDISTEYPAQAAVHHFLSDPLSLKSHEIIISIKSIVLQKFKNSRVTLSWSTTIQETCVQFFSPMNIRRYLYFYWAIWHPNVNIVHKPTFDPANSKAELIAAMSLMGACVSPDQTDLEGAKRWFNCVEEMVFNDDDLCDDSPAPLCRDPEEVQRRSGKLRALQAAYMVCLYQNWEGTNSSKRRIRRYRYSTVVAAVRDAGTYNARHPDYTAQNLCDFSFSSFAVREELIRVFLWIFLLDTAFVIFNNLPPRMVIREMKISTAYPEACFQAMTAEDCFRRLQLENRQVSKTIPLDFTSAFESLYNTHMDDALITSLADLGPLNLFAMTSALHSLIFHHQNSFSGHTSLHAIQQALQTWETVWNMYTTHFSQTPRHSPTATSSMHDLAPDAMWKRIGFVRHASEYWLLAKFMLERLTKSKSDDSVSETVPMGPPSSLAVARSPSKSLSATADSVAPLLEQYDQTSMQQINSLIADFQKTRI